jgi:serine/threonine-protein kinase
VNIERNYYTCPVVEVQRYSSKKKMIGRKMMFDIKKHEPLWGTWYVESLIGQGSLSKVYKIRQESLGKAIYSAVKVITIPQDEDDIRLMRREGLDDTAMDEFLESVTNNIVLEVELMSEFRGNSHIVSFEDCQIIEDPDSIRRDILIRMELLTSLSDFVSDTFLPQAEVIKLGIHMCRALELCGQKNIIHRDIKPDNIFVSSYGNYKLGDFGIARQIEQTTSRLSKKGTNTHMAPEVFKFEAYGAAADIYSLGIVMYSLLNQNRTPFLPGYPQPILPDDRDAALRRRMRGEDIPPLTADISPELNSIVMKACAYGRKERFSSPTEMREVLESLS